MISRTPAMDLASDKATDNATDNATGGLLSKHLQSLMFL